RKSRIAALNLDERRVIACGGAELLDSIQIGKVKHVNGLDRDTRSFCANAGESGAANARHCNQPFAMSVDDYGNVYVHGISSRESLVQSPAGSKSSANCVLPLLAP